MMLEYGNTGTDLNRPLRIFIRSKKLHVKIGKGPKSHQKYEMVDEGIRKRT